MMVLVLIWPFCYTDISNTLYLLLTTGHFINTIFTCQKYTHMETQTFNIVAYQCLDFSSIIPKGKMPTCIYKNTLNIKLDWKPTGPSKHGSVWAGMYHCQHTAPGQLRPLVNQKCSRDKKSSVFQLPLPAWLPVAAQGSQQHFVVPGSPGDFSQQIWQQRYVRYLSAGYILHPNHLTWHFAWAN